MLKYKTRGKEIKNKPRIYFCASKEDYTKYFDSITESILDIQNSVIYYKDSSLNIDDLSQINLFVVPITWKFLSTNNDERLKEFKYAQDNHIPILPIIEDLGIEDYFNEKCGNLQGLNPVEDPRYKYKLKFYIESVLVSDKLRHEVQAAFDAYIFLSYRKKDRKEAEKIMHIIHENDFCRDIAIWYDEFLTPGEDFNSAIDDALKKSNLFALVVTPNLVNEDNYVEKIEYPNAMKENKNILPIEAKETSEKELKEKYKDIPNPIKPDDTITLSNTLKEYLINEAWKENDDANHLYLIGIAYLNGIDVEVDKDKGVKILEKAANQNSIDAMKELASMYADGKGIDVDYNKAIAWQSKIYNYYKNIYGKDNITTLTSLSTLALYYANAKDFDAIEIAQKAYNKKKKLFGENNPSTLDSLATLGYCYLELEEYDNANDIYLEYYNKTKEVFGDNSIKTLDALNSLAISYFDIEMFDKARELSEDCYAKSKEILDEKNEDTLNTLNFMALSYSFGVTNYDNSIKLNKRCYEERKEFLGENHRDTLISLSNLASAYSHNGNHYKAKELFEECYKKRKDCIGENDRETLESLRNLAYECSETHDYKNSAKYYENLLDLRKKLYGQKNIMTINTMKDLLNIYDHLEDYQKAAKLCEEYYEIKKTSSEKITLPILYKLSIYYFKLSNYKKSKSLNEECYNRGKELLTKHDILPYKSLYNIGNIYDKEGNFENAIKIYEKCYDEYTKVVYNDTSFTFEILESTTDDYIRLGNFKKAQKLVLYSYNRRIQKHMTDDQTTLANLKRLVACSIKTNDKNLLKYLEEEYKIENKLYGMNDERCKKTLDKIIDIKNE